MKEQYLSMTEIETKKIAGELLGRYRDVLQKRALLFSLEGELGAGKTVFAKGIGEALGIKRPIRSPSFVLVTEYPYSLDAEGKTRRVRECGVGKPSGKFYHADLWRMRTEEEARVLKIEYMLKPGNVILIEWAQKFPELIEEFKKRDDVKVVQIKLSHKGEEGREVRIVNC